MIPFRTWAKAAAARPAAAVLVCGSQPALAQDAQTAADLAPGLYVIHVQARSRATAIEAGVGRDIAIRIQ